MNNPVGVFIDHTQFRALVTEIVQITVNKTLTELGLKKTAMSMHAACEEFGRDLIERYVDEGVIKRHRDAPGKMWRLNRIDIETAIATSNRIAHINHRNS
jgi:hypothetical protein